MNMNIAAVGSSPLIANEIRSAAQFIVGNKLPIATYSTYEIQADTLADLYICAQTQFKTLQKFIPENKIFVLDLTPTSKFFIEVSRIPSGETVYIFNNQLEYTTILSSYCESLGIENLIFVPIAFDEMPHDEIIKRLQSAKYIIGVDKFVGKNILLSDRYKSYLRPDIHIIAGTRIASVRSACGLLHGIAAHFHQWIDAEYNALQLHAKIKLSAEQIATLRQNSAELTTIATEAVEIIQTAAVQSVVSQISTDNLPISWRNDSLDNVILPSRQTPMQAVEQTLAVVKDLNHTLHILTKKLQKIM